MMVFSSMQDRFAAASTELLGLSIDSNPSHIEWTRRIGHYSWNGIEHPVLKFPIVADDMGNVARLYGMLMPSASTTRTVRNVFVIDPKGIVRAILIYPLTTGRNIDEIYRLVLALQAYDNTGDPTPADWEPGDSQILPAPTTFPMSNQRLEDQKNGAFSCLDWYLCLTKPAGEPAGTQAAQSSAAPSASSAAAPSMTSPAMNMPAAAQPAQDMQGMRQGTMPGQNIRYPDINYSNRPFVDEMYENAPAADSQTSGTAQLTGDGQSSRGSIMDENRSFFGMYR
jgi:peroxiredoxin (alkyl hydroperoxide reductase subunit C)